MKDLTVLIPTFDRPWEVNQRLIEITNELGRDTPVIVQVNPGVYGSNDITKYRLIDNFTINENPSNIGFVANIVCGLTFVETKWVWILGDDDPLKPGLRETIRSSIVTCERDLASIILFNQWRLPQDGTETVCSSLCEFLRATDFTDCLFISALVWRTNFLRENTGTLIDYSFTRASQAVIQLSALAEKSVSICIRNQALINDVYVHRWSRLDYLQRVDKIIYHPALSKQKKAIYGFMRPQVSWAFSSSLSELSTSNSKATWIYLVSVYSIRVLFLEGFSEAFGFLKPLLPHTAQFAKSLAKVMCLKLTPKIFPLSR